MCARARVCMRVSAHAGVVDVSVDLEALASSSILAANPAEAPVSQPPDMTHTLDMCVPVRLYHFESLALCMHILSKPSKNT